MCVPAHDASPGYLCAAKNTLTVMLVQSCHVALFGAVLVWSHVCICVNSKTNAGRSKQDSPGRKIPLPITVMKRHSALLAHPLCTFCLANTRIPNVYALLKDSGHCFLPSCNYFLLHFQEQTKSRQ